MDTSNAGFVQNWKIAGPILDLVLTDELREIDVPAAMDALSDAFESALLRHPRRLESGLVEQQAYFAKGLSREKAPRRCR
ncbi:MAG: hypothetical protein IT348_13350 [Candidatus Eisenbacteria bacterium]|nr:hypothetical protein [Candidatus Eisenbacteria bacterium]